MRILNYAPARLDFLVRDASTRVSEFITRHTTSIRDKNMKTKKQMDET